MSATPADVFLPFEGRGELIRFDFIESFLVIFLFVQMRISRYSLSIVREKIKHDGVIGIIDWNTETPGAGFDVQAPARTSHFQDIL